MFALCLLVEKKVMTYSYPKDRPHLQALFHAMVYAESETEYEEAKEALEEDEVVARYPQYLRHLERRYFPRHEEWSLSVRYRDQPT